MYLATRNFNQGAELYMNITAGIFLKATGSHKQSLQQSQVTVGQTLGTPAQVTSDVAALPQTVTQPRQINDVLKPSPSVNICSWPLAAVVASGLPAWAHTGHQPTVLWLAHALVAATGTASTHCLFSPHPQCRATLFIPVKLFNSTSSADSRGTG